MSNICSPEEVARSLRSREKVYFERISDNKEDFLENQEDSESVEECSEFEEKSQTDADSEEEEISTPEIPGAEISIPSTSRKRRFIYEKDKYKWCLIPSETRGRRSHITLHLPGGKHNDVHVKSPLEAWSLLFTDELLEIISKYTNQDIQMYREKETTTNATFKKDFNMTELKVYRFIIF